MVPIAPSTTRIRSEESSSRKGCIGNEKARAQQRGTSKSFEVFRVSTRRPSCLAGYFTWPQVALTHHVFHRAYTLQELRVSSLLGTYCRGSPPWPPLLRTLSEIADKYLRLTISERVPRRGGHGGPPPTVRSEHQNHFSIMGPTSAEVSCFFCHHDSVFQIDRLL